MISALMELLGNYYLNGDLTQLEMITRTIRTVIPDDVISIQILGLAYLNKGRASDALRLFREADGMRYVIPELGAVGDRAIESQTELATSVFYREATRRNSGFGKLWYDLGAALVSLKRTKQSIWAFRTAVIAHPEFPDALMGLGSAGLQVGDHVAAIEGFTKLLAMQPDNVIALRSLNSMNRPSLNCHSWSD